MSKCINKFMTLLLVHDIVVQIDILMKQMLHRSNLVERMTKWSIKMYEFDLSLE